MRYSQGDGVNTFLPRLVYCTHVYCVLVYLVLVDWCAFSVCEWVSFVARLCATKDANNKDHACKPNIPAGIKFPPPSKTISPITWFGTISTGCFLDDLRAFGINADQWTTAAQDAGEWRRTAKQGAEHFMAKWVAAETNKAGLRHAVVCPNVTRRTERG